MICLYGGALCRQWFVIWRCSLWTVICYMEVLFVDSDLLYAGALCRQWFVIGRCSLSLFVQRNKKWKTQKIPNCRKNVKIQWQNRRNRDKSIPLTQIYDDIHLKSTWPHIHFEFLRYSSRDLFDINTLHSICFIHVYYISKCDEKVWIHYFKDQIIYIVMSDRGPLNQYRSDTSSIKNNVRSTLRHI